MNKEKLIAMAFLYREFKDILTSMPTALGDYFYHYDTLPNEADTVMGFNREC